GASVHRPADPLGVALDVTPHREPERVRGPGNVAQLRERDPELGGPPERVDLRAYVPYRVPSVVLLAVVVHRVITLHAGGVHGELEARAAVVVGVHHDLQLIGGGPNVPPREQLENAVGMGVERADKDVEVAGGVGDVGCGGGAVIAVVYGLALPALSGRRRGWSRSV